MQIDSKTILTGLFASPSAHSVSPIIHNNAFEKLGLNYVYLSFEVNKDNLKDAVQSIKTLNMRGVNLSMPNKNKENSRTAYRSNHIISNSTAYSHNYRPENIYRISGIFYCSPKTHDR